VILPTLGANFTKANKIGCHFYQYFQVVCLELQAFCKHFVDFAQIFTDFSRIFDKSKLLGVHLHPLHPHLLHHCFFHPRSERSGHETSAQCMLCCFKYSNQFLAYSKLLSDLQNKRHLSEQVLAIFQAPARTFVQTANYLQSSVLIDSASKKALLLSFSNSAYADETKKTFFEAVCIKIIFEDRCMTESMLWIK